MRHEADYVVVVDGDLAAPSLEPTEHTEHRWFARYELERLKESRSPAEQLVYEIYARALRVTGDLDDASSAG